MTLETLAMKYGDVDGDGIVDRVFLVGSKTFGLSHQLAQDIQLYIEHGKTKELTKIGLPENMGYQPTLFLGDFTGNGTNDMLIVISTGGSGGMIYGYLYSYIDGVFEKIFDSEQFNRFMKYDVSYQDDYLVSVINFNLKQTYAFDITSRGEEYLSAIYDKQKKLKKPLKGDVLPLSGLYPIDFERDGTFELYAAQKVMGQYQADGFGIAETVLHWSINQFIPTRQYLALFGNELPAKRITLPPQHFVLLHQLLTEKKRNKQLEQVIIREYQIKKGIDRVRYLYNYIDLNGDGIPEVFVYLIGDKLCGNEGCSVAIFKSTPQGYQMLSKISPVFQPIVVSTGKSNGYKDLIVYVSGGGTNPFYAKLKYQQFGYPARPTLQNKVPENATVEGTLLFADGLQPQAGILL
jgi:hypothetical protein